MAKKVVTKLFNFKTTLWKVTMFDTTAQQIDTTKCINIKCHTDMDDLHLEVGSYTSLGSGLKES